MICERSRAEILSERRIAEPELGDDWHEIVSTVLRVRCVEIEREDRRRL